MVFQRLRTRLTVLYTALFGAALACVALAGYSSISRNAERAVANDLSASGAVFDHLSQVRAQQMRDGAQVISADFGFKAAVASGDEPTIRTALYSLTSRFKVDQALLVTMDGRVIGGDRGVDAEGLWDAVDSTSGGATGVLSISGVPYQAISEPVDAPVLIGWVVFATRLDKAVAEAGDKKMSSVQFDTAILQFKNGLWTAPQGEVPAGQAKALDAKVREAIKTGHDQQVEWKGANASIALVRPLPSLGDGQAPAALLLRFPLAQAMAPYNSLLETVLGAGLLGVILMIAGSLMIARSVTRPIHALEDAAKRLQQGESASVRIETRDEIGRLAQTFNAMAGDIAERQEKVTFLAMHDAPTGLVNRLAFARRIKALLAEGGTVVVAALAVDRFVQVRGAIGYALSDQLIAALGKALAPVCDGEPARLSDDTLGLVFDTRNGDISHRIEAALRAAEANIRLGEAAIDVNATLGLASHGVHGDTAEALVENASIALDQARARRIKAQFFDQAAYGDPASNLSLMSEMLDGLRDGHLKLYYQPKYDLRGQQVSSLEALCRWTHPLRGPLSPDLFIPMAEETGAIRALTDWTLEQAMADQRAFAQAGHAVAISINISGRLIGDAEFVEHALSKVREAAGKLCFEITETAVIDNPETALEAMSRLRDRGVAISIDDYGSGLSSLAYLRRIPAEELKIDKAFVLGLGETSREALLVRSTIELAHSLGLKVTAEGVETEIAAGLLAGMGCDLAQGYYIARPMPLDQMIDFLGRPSASITPVREVRIA